MNSTVSAAVAKLNQASQNGKSKQLQEQEMLAAARQIVSNLENPAEKILGFMFGPLSVASWEIAISTGVVDELPLGEGQSISLKELSRKVNADERLIKRSLQTLCAVGLLQEPQPNEFAHTEATRLFVTAPPIRAMTMEMVDIFAPAASLNSFMAKRSFQAPSSSSDLSPYRTFKNTNDTFYTIKKNKEILQQFNDAMLVTKMVAFDVTKFPWPEHLAEQNNRDEVAILDIGGGLGQLLDSVVEAFPDWYAVKEKKLMVQDRSDVLDLIRGQDLGFQVLSKSYLDECDTLASAYVYRWVFMDQPDERADSLLQALKPAFVRGAQHKNSSTIKPQKLILIENVIPTDTSKDPLSPGDAALDMIMMILSNSKCRTEEEIGELLARNGFKLVAAWKELENGAGIEKANGRGGKVLFEAVLAG